MDRNVASAATRIIAIGDIHGCSRALKTLIAAVAPTATDTVIPLGDVVDRGPDPKGAIELLLELRQACDLRPILGNHEEMMLSVIDGAKPEQWIWCGGVATLDSYGFRGDLDVIPSSHIDFIRSFADFAETAKHFFVHANYDPAMPLTQQPSRLIRWTSLQERVPGPHVSRKTAILGHTADRRGNVVRLPHLRCIDTYCYGGEWLTALDVVSGEIWQANQKGKLREAALHAPRAAS